MASWQKCATPFCGIRLATLDRANDFLLWPLSGFTLHFFGLKGFHGKREEVAYPDRGLARTNSPDFFRILGVPAKELARLLARVLDGALLPPPPPKLTTDDAAQSSFSSSVCCLMPVN